MSLPLTCHPTTPCSEAKSTELGLKAGRSLRLALGSWGRGTQRAKKRKKQPLLHLLAQKRKPAAALKASESSAAERMFLSLPPTREDLGPCVSPRQGPGQFWITAARMSPGGAGRQGKHLRGAPWMRGRPRRHVGCHTQRAELAAEGRGGEEARVSVAGACGRAHV